MNTAPSLDVAARPATDSPAVAAGRFGSCLAAAGYDDLLARWVRLSAADWLAEVNQLAAARGLHSAAGRPIRFAFPRPGEARLSALDYERRVHDEGRVLCRRDGDGVEHDRWNAAVWLAWPLTKAALNRLHARDDAAGARPTSRVGTAGAVPGQRSRVRDFATLVDESGLAWVSSHRGCDALLAGRRWQALFVEARADLCAGVVPIVIGHGLMGKLARPYKRLTAQAIIVPVVPARIRPLIEGPGWRFDEGRGQAGLAAADTAAIDAAIAQRLTGIASSLAAPGPGPAPVPVPVPAGGEPDAVGAVGAVDPPGGSACLPLPLLALPGWCDRNREPAFYDDPSVFRPGPLRPQR